MLAWIVPTAWYLIFLILLGPPLFCHQLCAQGQKADVPVSLSKPKELWLSTYHGETRGHELKIPRYVTNNETELIVVTIMTKI